MNVALNITEETIEATLDSNGQLQLTKPSRVQPGPVSVTIRPVVATQPQRGLADVIREIAVEQRARGYAGRSAAEVHAQENAQRDEDTERDQELDAARHRTTPRSP